jgi:hypothetical protein
MPHKYQEAKNAYSRKWKKLNRDKVSAYNREYRLKNLDEIKPKQNARNLAKYYELKTLFYDMYGRKCMCCGETRAEFLTIEHKQGRDGKHVGASGTRLLTLCTKEYRPDLYEVLCWNCNCSKGKYGYCPHNEESKQ